MARLRDPGTGVIAHVSDDKVARMVGQGWEPAEKPAPAPPAPPAAPTRPPSAKRQTPG